MANCSEVSPSPIVVWVEHGGGLGGCSAVFGF